MKKLLLAVLASATALAIVPMASATPITGTLNITGNDSSTTTSIDVTGGAVTSNSDGAFSSIVGQSVNIANPFPGVNADMLTAPLANGLQFYLQSYTLSVCPTSMPGCTAVIPGTWDVQGYGLMSLNGFDNTEYGFNFTTQVGALSSFSATATTPEPSSLLLLGSGLLGLAFVAFYRKAKPAPSMMLNM